MVEQMKKTHLFIFFSQNKENCVKQIYIFRNMVPPRATGNLEFDNKLRRAVCKEIRRAMSVMRVSLTLSATGLIETSIG